MPNILEEEKERVGSSVYYSLNQDEVAEYHKAMEYAFAHASTPCPYEFKCDTCPVKETCI